MLQRTTDTCHIAGPTTVSNKINGFTSFGCFRGVYISSQLSYGGIHLHFCVGVVVFGFFGCRSNTTIYDVTEQGIRKGERNHIFVAINAIYHIFIRQS